MKTTFFKEKQNFSHYDLLGLVVLFTVLTIGRLLYNVATVGAEAGNAMALGFYSLLFIGLLLFFLRSSLKIKVDERGVRYIYRFFQHKRSRIAWNEIQSVEAVETPLVQELSGWNVNFAMRDNRFSMGSQKGVLLHLKNGEQVYLSTNQQTELLQAIEGNL